MKIVVLNGSPKGDLSVTMQYVAYLAKSLSQKSSGDDRTGEMNQGFVILSFFSQRIFKARNQLCHELVRSITPRRAG